MTKPKLKENDNEEKHDPNRKLKRGEIVKTNLFQAMKTAENRKVIWKLGSFMLVEATIPLFVFWYVRKYAYMIGISDSFKTTFSAAISIILVNIIIFLYIFLAFHEDDETEEQKSKKNN